MPAPVVAPRRMGRLSSVKGPLSRRKRPQKPEPVKKCPNAECGGTEFEETDGQIICKQCYTQVAEANIVAEVTFEESAGGRATVQGGTVADNSRHAKTLGSAAFRRVGGGERNSLADIQNAGRRALQTICPKLGILEPVQVQAESIWTLAANINFSAGRKTDEVVAACLYAACRRQKDNQVLLMDISELLSINVFRLGEVYKDMCKELYLNNESVGHQYLQELEPLIKKYCDKLQFADKTKVVAEDALKIIRRMNRDWIVAGRHPAGLCGACIILAARMNNFQRSVREVVYVSKVADATIAKRVEEFRRTKSSGLSVDEFRTYANKLKHQHDPPSMDNGTRKAETMEKRKRKRDEHVRQQSILRESQERASQQPIEIRDDVTDASSRLSSVDPDMLPPYGFEQSGQQRVEGQIPPPAPPMTQQQAEDQQRALAAGSNGATWGPLANGQTAQVLSTPPATQGSPKRKRQDTENGSGSPEAESDNGEGPSQKRQRTAEPLPGTPSDAVQPVQATQQAPRYDADGFAIPALPSQASRPSQVDTNMVENDPPSPPKRGRGRPRKEDQPPPIDLSQEELAEEDYLEKEIEKALENGEVEESRTEVEKQKEEERITQELERAKALAAEQQKLDADKIRQRREAENQFVWDPKEEDLEMQFEGDPEIENCLLSPEEVRVKERIWVAHNEDWLRKQAEKEMLAKVARATGGSNRGRKKKDAKGAKSRRKRGKMGDGTVLTESDTPIETPADAVRAMQEKRAPQRSQFLDYNQLKRLYNRDSSRASSSAPEGSASQSGEGTPREQSVAPSEAESEGSASPAAEPQDVDMDDDEEGNEEQEDTAAQPRSDWDGINDDVHDDDAEQGDDAYALEIERLNKQREDGGDDFGVTGGDWDNDEYDDYQEVE